MSQMQPSTLLDRERAPVLLMNERGYTPYGELFDEALRRKRRVVQWVSAHRDDARVFKAYTTETRADHAYSLSANTWSDALSMPFAEADKQRLLDAWEERYTSKTWYNYQRLQHLTRPGSIDVERPQEIKVPVALTQAKAAPKARPSGIN